MNKRDPIQSALTVIAELTAGTGAVWLVGGSAGLQLRGLKLDKPPRDLDLYADERDAAAIHEALREYAIDEPAESVSAIYRSILSHYLIEGVNVELVGGFVVTSGTDRYAVEVRTTLYPQRSEITVGGCSAGIVPLAHEMWFNVLRTRPDRVRLIAESVRTEPGSHMQAFRAIESRNALAAPSVRRVHELIMNKGTENA